MTDDGRRRPERGGGDGEEWRYRWTDDEEVRRERLRGQLGLILRGENRVDGARAFTPTGDLADTEYLYLDRRLLVRDRDVDRVLDVLNGEGDTRRGGADEPDRGGRRAGRLDGVVDGLSVLELDGWEVPDACDELDRVIGNGIASPDHVFYVCIAHCCPADEPTPVAVTTPDPVGPVLRGTGAGVAVTVVDTGLVEDLTTRHDWLRGVTGEPDPCVVDGLIAPYGGHGSFIAGVVRSVAPEAQVHVISLVDQSEKQTPVEKLTTGKAGAVTESSILLALYQAMEDAPDVISLSAGSYTRRNVPPLSLEVFYERRLRHLKGTVLVAAAGNDATRQPFWPAAFEWCVSVGAVDAAGARAPFSNFGSWVDLYALGVDLVDAFPEGSFDYHEPPRIGESAGFPGAMARWSGTSFATPLVAGTVAARVSRTGQSGWAAADSVRRLAQANAVHGVGALVVPELADQVDPRDT